MLPFYGDSTMWGPQPEKERTQLKPGDRLTDGRIYVGDNPTAVLEAELQRIQAHLAPLEAKRDEILARLAEVAPEKYGATAAAAPAETPADEAEKPANTRKGKRASS